MSIKKIQAGEVEQLALGLNIDDINDDAESRTITYDQARMISENTRQKFEGQTEIKWHEDYWRLRNQGWPWRVAAYIAWAASPKHERKPKTQDDLAKNILGLTSDRLIATWRKKNPAIDEVIGLLQAAPLFSHRADIYKALISSATDPNYKNHPDRKLALELIGDYVPRSKVDVNDLSAPHDLSSLSDAELDMLAKKHGIRGLSHAEDDESGEMTSDPASQGHDAPGDDHDE